MERVRFIEHGGQQVLLLEYAGCTPEDVLEMMETCLDLVTDQPRDSVLSLSDLSGGHFNKDAVQRMKEVAAIDKPYVKRAAFVGASSLPKVFFDAITRFSTREFPQFETREEALEWLTSEEKVRVSA